MTTPYITRTFVRSNFKLPFVHVSLNGSINIVRVFAVKVNHMCQTNDRIRSTCKPCEKVNVAMISNPATYFGEHFHMYIQIGFEPQVRCLYDSSGVSSLDGMFTQIINVDLSVYLRDDYRSRQTYTTSLTHLTMLPWI